MIRTVIVCFYIVDPITGWFLHAFLIWFCQWSVSAKLQIDFWSSKNKHFGGQVSCQKMGE